MAIHNNQRTNKDKDWLKSDGNTPTGITDDIYTEGKVGIRNSSPQTVLDITSVDSGILVPRLTTVQRDAILMPQISELIWSIDAMEFEYWDGGAWTGLAGTFNGSLVYPNEFVWSPTGQQDDVSVFPSGTNTIFVDDSTNTGGFTITGIQNTGLNQQITFINDRGANVTFSVEDVSSAVGNRFQTQGGNYVLGNGGSVTLRWSTTSNGWRFISDF